MKIWRYLTRSSSFDTAQLTIAQCTSIRDLEFFISGLTQTADGCRWVVQNSTSLITAMHKVFFIGLADRNMRRLNLMNKILKKIEAQGVEMGSYLCPTALSYALRPSCILRTPSSARDYLATMASRKYMDRLFDNPAIRSGYPAQLITRTINTMRPISVCPDKLFLLTGWQVDGHPSPGEQQKLCLRDYIRHDRDYTICIWTIGRINSSKALWYEWNNGRPSNSVPQIPIPQRAAAFTGAFLRANDPWGAVNMLSQAALGMDGNLDLPAFVRLVREEVKSWKTVYNPDKMKGVVYILLEDAEMHGLSEDGGRRQDLENRVYRARKRLGYV